MQNYLLDTCTISEIIKPSPNKGVISWLEQIPEERLFISVLSLGEIQQGIEKLPTGKKKEKISNWFDFELIQRFEGRIVGITEKEALYWGTISGRSAGKGHTLPVIDAMLAASAICNNLIIVTNDTHHFEQLDIRVLNPWKAI